MCPTDTTHSARSAWASIAEIAEIVVPAASNRDEFIAECRAGKLDGVEVALRTFDMRVTGLIDAELIEALPASLKFICHNGVSSAHIHSPLFQFPCPHPGEQPLFD